MPKKPISNEFSDHVNYSEELIQVLEVHSPANAASERVLKLVELVEDIKLEMQKNLEAKSLLWLKQTVYTNTFNDNDKKFISDFFNQI